MTITYEIGDNLYINITNRCPNACNFCVREQEGGFEDALWLVKEPTAEEIIHDIFLKDIGQYEELVFCGYGEPLERIDKVVEVCEAVKRKSNIPIRINTNGLANKIHNTDVTPRFKSLVDSISISLNAKMLRSMMPFAIVCLEKMPFPLFWILLKNVRPMSRRCSLPFWISFQRRILTSVERLPVTWE